MPSKQNQLRPQELKHPRTIEVRVMIPWVIILVGVSLVGGLVGGWFIRTSIDAEARQAVHADIVVVEQAAKKAQQ